MDAELRVLAYGAAVREAQIIGTLRTIAFGEAVRTLHEAEALRAIAYALAVAENTHRASPAVAAAPPARRAALAAPQIAPAPVSWTDASFSAALFDGINNRRASAGLPRVTYDARLASAAAAYAQTMLGLAAFGHSVDGTTFDARIRAAGFTENVALGEIIAMSTGSMTPAAIVQMWMDSAPHREQILSSTFRLAGAGCAFAGAEFRCVVEFAG